MDHCTVYDLWDIISFNRTFSPPSDDFHFETTSMVDFNNSDCDEDDRDLIRDPDNDCPCCKQTFKYRYQLVSHLEKVHNRSVFCRLMMNL